MQDGRPGRGADSFIVRFPDGMRDRIKNEAAKNGRSMNAEIIARLERSFHVATAPTKDVNSSDDHLSEVAQKLIRLFGWYNTVMGVKMGKVDAEVTTLKFFLDGLEEAGDANLSAVTKYYLDEMPAVIEYTQNEEGGLTIFLRTGHIVALSAEGDVTVTEQPSLREEV